MNDLSLSAKYRGICPETVARLYAEELGKRKNAKEAEKALKTALHQITGAFMSADEIKRGRKLIAGGGAALDELLALHASTRERLEHIGDFYDALLSPLAPCPRVLDLACGLNPLYLGSRGYSVRGLDISGDGVALVNDWAHAQGWDVQAECGDLLCDPPLPAADVALVMKLLPVLEQQRKGAAMRLLGAIPAPLIVATFPTKTLSGRGVGMEKHYTEWFEALPLEGFDIVSRGVLFGELCYVIRRKSA